MTTMTLPAHEARPVSPTPSGDSNTAEWHGAVRIFKRALLEQALARTNGNRTRAARMLGLQRTYLLRLLHDLDVQVPPARQNVHRIPTRSTASAAR